MNKKSMPWYGTELFESLKGRTLIKVERHEDTIEFETTDGECFLMFYDQDCCADVYIDEIHGDLSDLVGSPILNAEERTSQDNPKNSDDDSFTWTFYELATIKGSVTIRWYGESNGYYSETASFERIKNE